MHRDDPTNPGFQLPRDGQPGDRYDWASIAAKVIHMDRRMQMIEGSVDRIRKTWSRLATAVLGSLLGIIVLGVSVLIQVGAYKERVDRLVDVTARLDQRIERLIYLQARGSQR